MPKKKNDCVAVTENDGKRRGSHWRQEVRKPVTAERALFHHFNKLYTLKWCSGWFYTLFSWSYLMFYSIWKSFFFPTLNSWRSGWGSLPWEHLLEAFMPILLHLNWSWNHWSVSVRFPLNLSPYRGMHRSFPKAASFSKVLSHISYNGHFSWMTMEKK